ncbi:MAG TPA: indolepyruvate oxidoreductase subunit beta family protein [Solirubrobacterales bacterium]|nr:indolepyruvate oxidoreductase subunit beta family protein [Solirubrobacterales bacterium]
MSSSWEEGARPLSVAILALGGEGGGVLADWIVATAEAAGFEAQTTSVAGVAQRTGATVYYLEMLPPAAASAKDNRPKVRETPVMSIFPTPGEVDVVIASELMESGRAVQRGFSTADRTTLITSTNRVYSIDEKISLGDGRVDDEKLLAGARSASKRLVADDFMALAEDVGSVISSSLLGALAGSEALPFAREAYEESIRKSGRGVEPSLAAFAAGFEAARSQGEAEANAAAQAEALAAGPVVDPFATDSDSAPIELSVVPGGTGATLDSNDDDGPAHSRLPEERKSKQERERNEIAGTNPASLVGPALADLAEQVRDFPAASRSMTLHGLVRTAVFQDKAYAARYLERVKRFAAADTDPDGEAELTREAARHVALWMAYQDTIQVAQQKLRQGRMARIRGEAKIRDEQLFEVREYLHPQIDEIIDTLPTWLGHPLSRSETFRKVVHATTHKGMVLNTSSVTGQTLLTILDRTRPLRPRSVRFVREQDEIDRWMNRALVVAPTDQALAIEIVKLQHVLKGYGSTYEHGGESFALLMKAADTLEGTADAGPRLAELHDAALADESGDKLQEQLADLEAESILNSATAGA